MRMKSPPALLPAKRAYRLWAPKYDTSPNPLLSLEQRTLARLLPSAAGRDTVDLGCGTGRSIVQLARIGARSITGVDFCQEMLGQAARKIPPEVRLVNADCRETHLPSKCCDWVLASFLISYLNELQAFANEVARISRPNAHVLIADVHPESATYGWKRTVQISDQEVEIQTQSYCIQDLRLSMQQAGFEQIYLHQACFAGPELAIFSQAGRPDLYSAVENLPVLFVAGYQRRSA